MPSKVAQNAFLFVHGELNDFLPPVKREQVIQYSFRGAPSIKNVIESVGIPHTEVEVITVRNQSIGFEYQLSSEDKIDAYPVSRTPDVSPVIKLRPDLPPGKHEFILDVHLGKLARLLRLLGINTYYRVDYNDTQIVNIASRTSRIIITRDRRLLHIKSVVHGYWPRSTDPPDQLLEVVNRYNLFSQINPYSRCLVCNGEIRAVEKGQIRKQVPPRSKQYYRKFYRCSRCRNIYWQGSHCHNLDAIISRILKNRPGIRG